MKTFVSALTLGLIVAFSAPAFAGSQDAPKKTEQSNPAKQQEDSQAAREEAYVLGRCI